ncbi:DNA polymerase III subunit delta' [Aureimonas fodinaquatilis]|uniref:DNA polymerase III subunit delta' n=1 Tax=Aureimonas fodinaquatilis TaxID=2565783 RepID=UPI001FEBD3DE|nr:DNA polymerase III subunit delta' [Aureimonas fodinaquatilis]
MDPAVNVAHHDDIDGIVPPAGRDGFVGHASAWAELNGALQGGRMHHAWLLQGPNGIGKATLAFAFARMLLAQNGDQSAVARQIAQGSHPGLVHLARPQSDRTPGFKTQITVDEVRRLMHFFHTTAGLGWRVAIVDPVDDMNRSAANALLKILEEPPARSVFLVINHMPGRLLPTIRSRCRVLKFAPLAVDDMVPLLRSDVAGVTATEATNAAELSGGSLRTAFQRLVSGGLEVGAEVARLFEAKNPDWAGLVKLSDALTLKGREAAFDLMMQDLFALLAVEAETAAKAGNLAQAERLAAFWAAEDARWREAFAFNLDRKQVVLTFFHGLAAARGHSPA